MAIVATLASHKLGSIEGFPSLLSSKSVFGKKLFREQLQSGNVAGSLPMLHRHIREQTNPGADEYRFHMGGFLLKAARACLSS